MIRALRWLVHALLWWLRVVREAGRLLSAQQQVGLVYVRICYLSMYNLRYVHQLAVELERIE